ncbi:glycosyltransferase family protein [Edwardsiella tarda]|uniref:glycosyltransferase family 4 protein n=1 Tax=Edwardsiella tarda TaxID=636 RepID=UPI000AAE5298|nr:glycosyltransferase family 4 protein [Edwardsiella tarda]UBU95210.1 hypothetical protein AAW15_16735 [Edwardsiella tarda]
MGSTKLVIVGCLPEPIGGVSDFCQRLSEKLLGDGVKFDFIDLYPSKLKAKIASNPNLNYKVIDRKNILFRFINMKSILTRSDFKIIFFNFSSQRAMVFLFFLLPLIRGNKRIYLCLHHGTLSSNPITSLLYSLVLRRMTKVFSLSDAQSKFYGGFIDKTKIISSSSYIPLSSDYKKETLSRSFNVFIAGSEDFHYHLKETLHEIISYHENDKSFIKITVVVYGRYSNKFVDSLMELKKATTLDIQFFFDLCSADFNKKLSEHDIYIRNTSIDSFGISVADANEMGVSVIASDVCQRYPGTYLFKYRSPSSFLDVYDKLYRGETDSLIVSEQPRNIFPYEMFSK